MTIAFTKLNTVNDEKTITSAIQSLHKTGETLQLNIHRVLVAIAVRWAASGDMRPVTGHINMLLQKDKLGGIRKNAIRAWVETYMGLKLVEEGDNKGEFYVPADLKAGKHMNIKELTNNRWWEFKPEPEYTPIADPIKLLKQLTGKMEKDRQQLGEESKVDPAMIEALKAMTTPEVLQ